MNDEFQQLTIKRSKWVEANQENGFDEGIKRLLTDLYPDNAHFIYELLQNAEDAGANSVNFILNDDSLEFNHDGKRLFSIRDVESITSIGNSTKRDDPTSIGKFGVGFKAVFAYTNTPQVHSGGFSFRIEDLVIPRVEAFERETNYSETRFIFPFNNPSKLPNQAREEIESALLKLSDSTLLFLSNIRYIEYTLPEQRNGFLFRQQDTDGSIMVTYISPLDAIQSHWLRFDKEVEVQDDDSQPKTCRIAIAYHLTEEEQNKIEEKRWKITPVDNGQVSIYFPAEKETSNLRFHLHAPFASTVARDSVRDCRANDQLRDHLAQLTAESLLAIRDKGLLTVDFLGVMPNPLDNLPDFYEPIRKTVVEAFRIHALTPAKSGVHTPANRLYRGPARISEVLDDVDLALLTASQPPLWVANPPQQNQREDRFLESLEISGWSWAELVESLEELHSYSYTDAQEVKNLEQSQRIEGWIAGKPDNWVMRYYSLLGEACDIHQCCVDIDHLKIIRVGTEEGDDHVYPRDAYTSIENELLHSPDVKLVKPAVYLGGRSDYVKKYASAFLENVGIQRFDARVAIERILGDYEVPVTVSKVKAGHYNHIKQFVAYVADNPSGVELFRRFSFIVADSLDGSYAFIRPHQLCIDIPYLETGLRDLRGIHKRSCLSSIYNSKLTKGEVKGLVELLVRVGAMTGLSVVQETVHNNPERQRLWEGTYNSRDTHTGINEDYTIMHISEYIKSKSISASRLIWNAIISADGKIAKARYRPNRGYDTRVARSRLVCTLSSTKGIPNEDGLFFRPQDITKSELCKGFIYDDRNGLLSEIGFGESAKRLSEEYKAKNERAQELGFNSYEEADEAARILKEKNLSIKDLKAILEERKAIEQPESPVSNPERRRKGVGERHENAPTKESITRERKIQPGLGQALVEAKAYLRPNYTNGNDELVCQCCHNEMPFKVNDAYYFEAVQCVRNLKKNHIENRLALCPTCSAMYQYARVTDDEEIIRRLVDHEAPDDAAAVEIPITLAGKDYALRFVGKHWFDLKTLLQG